MSRYVLMANHSPDLCPSSNARVRARVLEALNPENQARITSSLGIETVFGPFHLDPSHRTVALLDAPSVEAVSQFVMETGIFQWNTVEVCAATPVQELMPRLLGMPVLFD